MQSNGRSASPSASVTTSEHGSSPAVSILNKKGVSDTDLYAKSVAGQVFRPLSADPDMEMSGDEAVCERVRAHRANDALQALKRLDAGVGSVVADYDALMFVNGCMVRNREEDAVSAEIQEISCRVAYRLLRMNSELIHFVGENQIEKWRTVVVDESQRRSPLSFFNQKIAIHRSAMYAIMLYSHNSNVVKETVNLFSILVSMTNSLHQTLIGIGVHWAILQSLKDPHSSPENAFKTLHMLSVDKLEYGRAVLSCAGLGAFVESLTRFSEKKNILKEALRTVAYLMQFVSLLSQKVCLLIQCLTSLLEKHSADADIIDLIVEVMISLSAGRDSGEFRILKDLPDFIASLSTQMVNSWQNDGLQLKGCLLLRDFCPIVHETDDVSLMAAAMSQSVLHYSTNLMLLAEGCSALYVYAVKFESAAQVFVEEGVHLKLFEVLQSQADFEVMSKALAQLVCDCVFSLACIQRLKDEMLCSAASEKLLGGVKCLVALGADINCYVPSRGSPLPLAALAGSIDIVNYFLYEGVSMSHVYKALRGAIVLNQPPVISCLFQYLSTSGRLLDFKDLNLCKFETEWFSDNKDSFRKAAPLHFPDFNVKRILPLSGISIGYWHDLPPSDESTRRDIENDSFTCPSLSRMMMTIQSLHVSHKEEGTLFTVLDLSSNCIDSMNSILIAGFPFWESLTELHIAANKLYSIPQNLPQVLPVLEVLDCSSNQLERFPCHLLLSRSLLRIDLSKNQVSVFDCYPDVVWPLESSLQEVDLSENLLTFLPGNLYSALPHLRLLNVSKNHISSHANEPLGLQQLSTLDMSHNELTSVSFNFFGGCYSLEELNVSHNKLQELCKDCSFELSAMRVVNAAHNQLGKMISGRKHFPGFLLRLPRLEKLDLSCNYFDAFPNPGLWSSKMMKEIDLSVCCFSEFDLGSDAFQRWNDLERVSLQRNQLTEVSRNFGCLANMTALNVSGNPEIKSLPIELGKLEKLCELNLSRLPELCLPGGSRDLSPKSVVQLLRDTFKNGVDWNCSRLFVIGQRGCGKTTLISKLTGRNAPNNCQELTVTEWRTITGCRDGEERGAKGLTISCWEFASRRRSRILQQSFYNGRAIYMVVFRLTDGLLGVDSVRQQLKEIYAHVESASCLLVGTNLDHASLKRHSFLEEVRLAVSALQCSSNGIPKIFNYVEANCHITEDINQIRDVLLEAFVTAKDEMKRPLIGERVPNYYKELLEDLQTERLRGVHCFRTAKAHLPVLTISSLLRSPRLELTSQQLAQALNFLHSNGDLYQQEMELTPGRFASICVLDMPWLCGILARVARLRLWSSAKTGLVRKADLWSILVPILESNYLTRILISILNDFNLAVSYGRDHYLLPSLIPILWTGMLLPHKCHFEPHLERHYVFPFAPADFWLKLVSLLVVFSHEITAVLLSSSSTRVSEPDVKFWSEGVCVFWNEGMYFLVQTLAGGDADCVCVQVPVCENGTRILAAVVNRVEGFIQKRPDLKFASMKVLVPCPNCQDGDQNVFTFEELVTASLKHFSIKCPLHKESVPLKHLIPELMLNITDDEFDGDPEPLVQKTESLCNSLQPTGSFSLSTYQDRPVLVKSYSAFLQETFNLEKYEEFLLQVQLGFRLVHWGILPLCGYSVRQFWLSYQFPLLGTLESVLASRKLRKIVAYQIACQITSALSFIHKNLIAHNSLSTRTVFIPSLSLQDEVNAKIGDFSRASWMTPSAVFLGNEHFSGNSEKFGNRKNDIFSLGGVLSDLSQKCYLSLPEFEAIAGYCLSVKPFLRPTASTVDMLLRQPEVICIEKAVPVSLLGTEAIAIKSDGEQVNEVWLACSDSNYVEISVVDLSSPHLMTKGVAVHGKRILCLATVRSELVLAGCLNGDVLFFDHLAYPLRAQRLMKLQDSVLCVQHLETDQHDVVLFGLADGTVAFFETDELMRKCPKLLRTLRLGRYPVAAVCLAADSVLFGHGPEVVVWPISLENEETRWTASKDGRWGVIARICVGVDSLWTSSRRSSRLLRWSLHSKELVGSLNCEPVCQSHAQKNGYFLDSSMCWVTSLLLIGKEVLWTGTSGGFLVAFCPVKMASLVIIKKSVRPIRCLEFVRNLDLSTKCGIVTACLTDGFSSAGEVSGESKRKAGQLFFLSCDSHKLVEAV